MKLGFGPDKELKIEQTRSGFARGEKRRAWGTTYLEKPKAARTLEKPKATSKMWDSAILISCTDFTH